MDTKTCKTCKQKLTHTVMYMRDKHPWLRLIRLVMMRRITLPGRMAIPRGLTRSAMLGVIQANMPEVP